MSNQPATLTRTIRIPHDVWNDAMLAAVIAGESVAAVVNRALRDYALNPPARGSMNAVDGLPCTVCKRKVKRLGGGGMVAAKHNNPKGRNCEGGGA